MAVPIKSTANYDCYLRAQKVVPSDFGGSNEIYETWIIVKKEGGIIRPETPEWYSMMTETAVPKIGEYYDVWSGQTPTLINWQHFAKCRNHEFTTTDDGRVEATFRFQTYYQADPSTYGASAVLHLPTVIEAQHSTRQIALFRNSWTTNPPAALDESAADIGGTAAFTGTKDPMESTVAQTRIRVRLTMDTEYNDLQSAILTMESIVGKRNSNAFINYSPGTVYCESFAINKLEGEFYEITIDFVYDQYYEHDQYPEIAADGKPKTNSTGTQFTDVRWKRVNRSNFDFNTIFAYTGADFGTTVNTDRKALATKGYWA
jgi:hypothetical protein